MAYEKNKPDPAFAGGKSAAMKAHKKSQAKTKRQQGRQRHCAEGFTYDSKRGMCVKNTKKSSSESASESVAKRGIPVKKDEGKVPSKDAKPKYGLLAPRF